MANNSTKLSDLPSKTILDLTDQFIIYSEVANGNYLISANNLVAAYEASSNGYITLIGNIILNWGTISANNSAPATITFSKPYSSTVFTVNLTGQTINTDAQCPTNTLTTATVITNSVANVSFYYTAIGL